MNTDPNNNITFSEDEPRLVPPQVVYEKKAALKKKSAVIPMFATFTAAAAAVALLFGLFWKHPSTPKLELTAELKPIVSEQWKVKSEKWKVESEQLAESSLLKQCAVTYHGAQKPVQTKSTVKRHELPLLATMTPAAMPNLTLTDPQVVLLETTLAGEAMAWTPEGSIRDEEAELLDEQGEKSEVELVEFGEMLRRGWRSVKGEIAQLNESVGEGFRLLKQMPAPPSFHAD